ncbi:hypothetical protein F442_13176 [Phytophthora nicotianae P10297]|uniref:Uncharacterized protein n=4 Tax=Phytophthora nicotianae TaxID=4792 RepID=V9EQF2_PHYNI|nr:hypothetical protein F443_13309 [Phytophthora nicotianae P1569]ETK81505.1 hypothetical protein L915_13001 [Phytophthora nicotianae]ETO70091.1 hypothetical protein F444_13385 [Phytophthora nicotianae P1976]ETP39348.1 hypothetical protein F442_13176 [Phytophthora nicotianae P10297]
MTVEVMSKPKELIDEHCRMTLSQLCDCLHSDIAVVVSKTPAHRALQSMLYSIKQLRIKKATMNPNANKEKHMEQS